MSARVSVIVPLFNKAAYIRRTLDSIAAQSYSDVEVLVVDDGSTDGGERIAADYGDPRFRLVQQSNAGPGSARNHGIAEAKGELLAFLDGDDEWLPDYLATGVTLLDRYGPDVASVSMCWQEVPDVRHIEKLWHDRGVPEGAFRVTVDTPPRKLVHLLAFMSPCSTLARAEVVRHWGGFYDRDRCLYAEDAHLWLKLLLNQTVAFHSTPKVRVHVSASELSNNLRGKRALEPFLAHPSQIEGACPKTLRPLLARFFALRAFKTACVWGVAGYWREAAALRRQFRCHGDWKLEYYLPSAILSTPLGAVASTMRRALGSS